ncbi:PepSY domain-containing protein, partial [Candidatus Symbiopectobacterium sp. NZEC135]
SVLAIARQAGISANKLEIRPAKTAHNAWTVTEIERRWPTQADMVAINPDSGAVVDYVRFADYPFAAKLTRWGIGAHMGVLFGFPGGQPHPANTLFAAFTALPLAVRVLAGSIALLLGGCLPVMGGSLLIFLLIDIVRWRRYQAIQNADALPHTTQ